MAAARPVAIKWSADWLFPAHSWSAMSGRRSAIALGSNR
jgi:hypothetical protein